MSYVSFGTMFAHFTPLVSFVQRSEDRPSNRHKDGSLARRDDRPLMHSINNQVSQDIVHDKPLTLRDYESARRDHNEPSVHRNKKTQAHRGDYSFSGDKDVSPQTFRMLTLACHSFASSPSSSKGTSFEAPAMYEST